MQEREWEIEGWEEVVELAEGPRVDDWIEALDKAEHIFRTTLITKTNANSIREGIIETQNEYSDLRNFLDAREVYRELTEGQHEDLLDEQTLQELLDVYYQAILDLRGRRGFYRNVARKNVGPWLWWILGAFVLILMLWQLRPLLGPIFSVLGLAVAGIVGVGALVLGTFIFLDHKHKIVKKKRSE